MTTLSQRIKGFEQLKIFLNDFLREWQKGKKHHANNKFSEVKVAIEKSLANNAWYTEETIKDSLEGIIKLLDKEKLLKWLSRYNFNDNIQRRIGVVMAGNIPMVGFHDFLCVLISGHKFIGKLSSDDPYLLPSLANILKEFESDFTDDIYFTTEKLIEFDAIIATGSDNSSRYFEYYFGKYPNIIRSNRNSVAILDGSESIEDFQNLAKDIFAYFGLGCRSVSCVFLPKGSEPRKLFEGFTSFESLLHHNKYFNNYEYNKAIFLVNGEMHYDNGFLLMKEDKRLSSAVAVLHYQFYDDIKDLNNLVENHRANIQCVVSKNAQWPFSVSFGHSQRPSIDDYADNIDTMDFLLNLK